MCSEMLLWLFLWSPLVYENLWLRQWHLQVRTHSFPWASQRCGRQKWCCDSYLPEASGSAGAMVHVYMLTSRTEGLQYPLNPNLEVKKLQNSSPMSNPFPAKMLPLFTHFCFLFEKHFIFTLSYFTPYHDFLPETVDFNVQPYWMLFGVLGEYNPRFWSFFSLLSQ